MPAPVATTELLAKYGGWGLSSLLICALIYVERSRNEAVSQNLVNLKAMLEALAGFKETLKEFASAVAALRAMLEERRYSIGDVSRQLDAIDTRVRHGMGNISTGINALATFLPRMGYVAQRPPLIAQDDDGGAP